jgi:SAM-dependent methyltransferase
MLGRLLKDLVLGRWRAPPARAAAPPTRAPVVTRYRPEVFDVPDEAAARAIILTPSGGTDTGARWELETPYLVRLAIDELQLRPGMRVVDYGCGIGRLARELIASTHCTVVGVDISASMRRLAVDHVRSAAFEVLDPEAFAARSAAGARADAAIACWVLQHCLEPSRDIASLFDAMRPGARLLVVNNRLRAVPGDTGWVNDGIDIAALLDARFRRLKRSPLDAGAVAPTVAQVAYVAVYERP